MLNYLEYNRPTPASLSNSVRVSSGGFFRNSKPRPARKAQKRKGHLSVAIVRNGEVVGGKRISKKTACTHLGLWNSPKVINHKPIQ
jgi:hypothetical protein